MAFALGGQALGFEAAPNLRSSAAVCRRAGKFLRFRKLLERL